MFHSAKCTLKRVARAYVPRVLLVICAILFLEAFFFAVLQLGSRQPNPEAAAPHLYDAFRLHRPNPQYAVREHTYGLRINSDDGFRRDESVFKEKSPGTIRVIALGGSALYGAAAAHGGHGYPEHPLLRNNETITFFLEEGMNERLAADGLDAHRVEVINAGVTGYHTYNELVYLNAVLLDYEPDWVINLDGNNDFYGEIPGVNGWSNAFYGTASLVELTNRRSFFLPIHLFVRSIAPYSYTFSLGEKLTKRIFRGITQKAVVERGRTRNMLQTRSVSGHSSFATSGQSETCRSVREYGRGTFLRSLWQINRLGRLEKYGHLVFLQPQVVFEADGSLTRHDRDIKRITKERVHRNWELMIRVREQLPEIFEELQIPFFDLGEIAARNAEGWDLYLDYCHLTPDGSKLVAARIREVLYPLVRAGLKTVENDERG